MFISCVCVYLFLARTGELMGDFGRLYEQQYAVALFNQMRYDVEGGGGPQPQLLHRKVKLCLFLFLFFFFSCSCIFLFFFCI